MNRTQLAAAVAERTGAGPAEARRQVDAVLDSISTAVAAGERVSLLGFGTFDSTTRSARTARNPRTGATIDVPAAVVPRFRVGAAFKARVADGSTIPVVTGTADADPGERQGARPSAKKARSAPATTPDAPAKSAATKAKSGKKSASGGKKSSAKDGTKSSAKSGTKSSAKSGTKSSAKSGTKSSAKSGTKSSVKGGKKPAKKGKKK